MTRSTPIRSNAVYEIQHGGGSKTRQRALFVDQKSGSVVLIDIRDPKASYHKISQSDFEACIRAGSALRVEDPFLFLHKPIPLAAASQGRLDWRKAVAEPYLKAKKKERFSRKGRAAIVAEMCDEANPNHCTKPEAYHLIRLIDQRGQIPEALSPDHWKAGYSRQRRAERPPTKRDGRDRIGHTYEQKRAGIPLTPLQKLEMSPEVVRLRNTRAKNGRKTTWREVHLDICRKFFSSGQSTKVDGKKVPLPKGASQCPSIGQLQALYYPATNPEIAGKAREGERLFNLMHRARLGDQRDLAYGPGELVQIDFTVADIYLLDFSKRRLVGRPTIALLKDTMARLYLGFAVSWGRESWVVASLGMLNSVCDKAEFCASLGITITADQWPSAMGETFLSDNGPMISRLTDHFRERLLSHFKHTPSGRGDLKAVVESGFRDLNERLIHTLDGSLIRIADSREMKRRIKHARSTALYNLHELTAMVADYCIEYNNHRVLSGYPLSDDMVGRVSPIPIRLWEYGIENRDGAVYLPPLDLVRMHCLCEGVARVDENGIDFHGKPYACKRAFDEGWFVKAGHHSWHIKVLYHPADLSIIYIDNPDCPREEVNNCLEPCFRIRTEGDIPHISMWENRHAQIDRKLTIREASELGLQHEAIWKAKLASHRERAIAAKPGGTNAVPAATTENMNIVRAAEAAREHASVHDKLISVNARSTTIGATEGPLEYLESQDRNFRRELLEKEHHNDR
jgi:hypothetical protein